VGGRQQSRLAQAQIQGPISKINEKGQDIRFKKNKIKSWKR
jgi:hypothetical protein